MKLSNMNRPTLIQYLALQDSACAWMNHIPECFVPDERNLTELMRRCHLKLLGEVQATAEKEDVLDGEAMSLLERLIDYIDSGSVEYIQRWGSLKILFHFSCMVLKEMVEREETTKGEIDA